jgi:tRNA pseudouridine65 synthase
MLQRDSNAIDAQVDSIPAESSAVERDVSCPPLTILDQNEHFLIVSKPPSVVCHHSEWTGSRGSLKNDCVAAEIPMLQRVREQTGRRVNLVHRLDRGASGCLLLTFADNEGNDTINSTAATTMLIDAMADKTTCTKTYIALVRGEGILHGKDLKEEGWFLVDRPIKNEKGVEKNATTRFRFIAGQDNGAGTNPDKARASLVLARPETGRWHQIRKHLNGLSHPILGDTTHGSSRVNREWKEQRGMPTARTCLHLSRLQIGPTKVSPSGIDVWCALAPDMLQLLKSQLPDVLAAAEPILREEGIRII